MYDNSNIHHLFKSGSECLVHGGLFLCMFVTMDYTLQLQSLTRENL